MRKSTSKGKRSLKLLAALLAMTLCEGNFANAYAHAGTNSPVQTDRELLIAANEEIRHLTDKLAAMDKLDSQRKALIATLDELITSQARTLQLCKAALATGDKIEGVDDKLLKSLQTSLDDAKKEIARYQAKAAFWKRVASFGMLTVAVIGAAIGYVLGSK